MIKKDHVFVIDVVVTNLTWEMMASNVINRPIGATTKFNTIVKVRKYRGLHERHHFISMGMKVHGTHCFIRECACLFHDRRSRGHLSLFFCIQFFR